MDGGTLRNQPKVRVFGSSGALCAEAVVSQTGYPTVNLEFAIVRDGKAAWDNKMVIQPDSRELPLLAALLIGYRASVSFKRDDKGVELKRQTGNKVYMRASSNALLVNVPAVAGDAYQLATLVLDQLAKSSHCGDSLMLVALRANAGEQVHRS